jgi:hypothetical protein
MNYASDNNNNNNRMGGQANSDSRAGGYYSGNNNRVSGGGPQQQNYNSNRDGPRYDNRNYFNSNDSITGNQVQSHNGLRGPFGSRLLPNEVRVKTNSDFDYVIQQVMNILMNRGYKACKIVGRGTACALTQEIANFMKKDR